MVSVDRSEYKECVERYDADPIYRGTSRVKPETTK
jgi:hypothetical protein